MSIVKKATSGRALLLTCCLLAAAQCGKNPSENNPAAITTYVKTADVEPVMLAANPLLKLLPAEQTGIDFRNIITETDADNFSNNINKYNGGGLAIADINNDGLQDIYFVCSNGKNAMYLNEGNFKFKNIAAAAGLASEEGFETSATTVDINGDGWPDFYVCRAGHELNEARRNKLFVNNQNGTFTERAAEYGLDNMRANTGANFFDADNDGDLDLYLLAYPSSTDFPNPMISKTGPDGRRTPDLPRPFDANDSHRFFRNDGPPKLGPDGKKISGGFTDISEKAGVATFAWGLSTGVTDFNRDGWPDIYVGNDFLADDILYINNRNGTFTNRLPDYFRHVARHTMGSDLTDFDNDGLVDLFAVDMLPEKNLDRKTMAVTQTLSAYTTAMQNGYHEPVVRNVLQRNNGNGTFSDVACVAGVFKTDWSWSALVFDMDNDGLRDLHVANGYRWILFDLDFVDFKLPEIKKMVAGTRPKDVFKSALDVLQLAPELKPNNVVYQNNGGLSFADKRGDWMTMPPSWSCGAAWADLDNDGDLDLVVNNLEDPAFLYQNLAREQGKGNFLQIKLKGNAPNTQANGASALIEYDGGKVQYLELNNVRGIFSSVEDLLHFGLAGIQTVDKLTVRWPDGKTQTMLHVPVNQRLTLKQSEANGPKTAHIGPRPPAPQFFEEKTATAAGLDWTHTENPFNDFETWFLNPWRESDLGPLAAVGDVNGDGLDDFFLGNAFDQPAAMFLQNPGGRFRRTGQPLWESEKIFEDHGSALFDADGDGDLDLYAVSGSMEAKSPLASQNRLYWNDGKGNFSKAAGALPEIRDVGLRVVAQDFDSDGDKDIFVGGRVTAGKWPLTPRSFILQNDGKGKFVDVTKQVAPDFEQCGMVTDLKFANLDADAAPELVVVGEFTPVMVFKFSRGKFVNSTQNFGLEKSGGLWNSLAVSDLDGDGDQDLITGNFGLNTRLVASGEFPLRCFAKDFDGNGQIDPLMAYAENGQYFPIAQKDVLNKNSPILKKKFIYARAFGHATVDKVWPQKDLDAALNLTAHTLETCWWENQNGHFVQRKLPLQAQVSPVQGILAADFTGDGLTDILMAGNKYGLEVETNRCDASNGALLRGDGRGNFSFVENTASGFWAMNEARDLGLLRAAGGKSLVLVANNHARPQVFLRK